MITQRHGGRSEGLARRAVTSALRQGVRGECQALVIRIASWQTWIEVRPTKQQINDTMEIAGMNKALNRSLEIDLELEGEGSIDKKAFLEELRKGGLRGALAWRDQRFDE